MKIEALERIDRNFVAIMRRIDPTLESKLQEYFGDRTSYVLRNLLKPPSEERFWIPDDKVRIRTSRKILELTPEDILERIKDDKVKAEIKEYEGEIFVSVKTIERKSRRDPDLLEIKLDRIGSVRALVGRRVRGKHIITKDVRPGKRYNVGASKGPFIGIGFLSDRPGSSKAALYMHTSPRFLPDLRGSDLHEIGALHPIPRGATLSVIEDDVSGKNVALIPAPDDLGIAALLAKRGANVYIATELRGLLNRVKKIRKRIGIEINAIYGKPDMLLGKKYDLVIVNTISSDIGLRPQPYVEYVRPKAARYVKIAKKYLNIGLKALARGGHLIYVVNTIDPREVRASLGDLILLLEGVTQIDPGLDGFYVDIDGIKTTIVTRDEGPYFAVSRLVYRRSRASRFCIHFRTSSIWIA